MIRRIFFGLTLILAACIKAYGADAPKPTTEESLRDSTVGVLVLTQDGQQLGLIFVSKTGQILPENTAACEASEECGKLTKRLHDEQHMTLIVLPSTKPDPQTVT